VRSERARVAELVGAWPARRVALDLERDRVDTDADPDLALGRFGAAFAPHARLVLAGREAAKAERVGTVDRHVRGRVDDEDERRHARVDVAAEPDQPG